MKKIYSSHNNLLVGHLASMLEEHGVRCMVKNQFLSGGAGELPPNECWPELWVMEDREVDLAKRMIDQSLRADTEGSVGWNCECGEKLEAQFTQCWKCGSERLGASGTQTP